MSTILTLKPTELLVVRKEPYLALLRDERTRRLGARLAVLRQVQAFHHWPTYTLELVAEVLRDRIWKHNDIIIKEGSTAENSVFIIVRGRCRVLQRHAMEGSSKGDPVQLRFIQVRGKTTTYSCLFVSSVHRCASCFVLTSTS